MQNINQRWYTHESQLTQFMPPPETYKRKIGSQSTMCQVYTGAYVSLLAPGKTNYTACHPRKTTTHILHVVSITTHTHNRRKSMVKKKQTKRKERKWVHGAKKKKLLLLHLMLCVCQCCQLAFMLVVHTAVLTQYARVSSFVDGTTTSSIQKGGDMKWRGQWPH